MTKAITICAISVGLLGCTTVPQPQGTVPAEITNAVFACGGGMASSINAELAASVNADWKTGGKLSAEATKAIETAYFRGADPSNAEVRQAYQTFVDCVNHRLDR